MLRLDLDLVALGHALLVEADRGGRQAKEVVALGELVAQFADHLAVHHQVQVVRLVELPVHGKVEAHLQPGLHQVGLLPAVLEPEGGVVVLPVAADVGVHEVDLAVPGGVVPDPQDALELVIEAPAVDSAVPVGVHRIAELRPVHGVGVQVGAGHGAGRQQDLVVVGVLVQDPGAGHQLHAEDLLAVGEGEVRAVLHLLADGLGQDLALGLGEALVQAGAHGHLQGVPGRKDAVPDHRADADLIALGLQREVGEAVAVVVQDVLADELVQVRGGDLLPAQLHLGQAHVHGDLGLVRVAGVRGDADREADVGDVHVLGGEAQEEVPLLLGLEVEGNALRALAEEAHQELAVRGRLAAGEQHAHGRLGGVAHRDPQALVVVALDGPRVAVLAEGQAAHPRDHADGARLAAAQGLDLEGAVGLELAQHHAALAGALALLLTPLLLALGPKADRRAPEVRTGPAHRHVVAGDLRPGGGQELVVVGEADGALHDALVAPAVDGGHPQGVLPRPELIPGQLGGEGRVVGGAHVPAVDGEVHAADARAGVADGADAAGIGGLDHRPLRGVAHDDLDPLARLDADRVHPGGREAGRAVAPGEPGAGGVTPRSGVAPDHRLSEGERGVLAPVAVGVEDGARRRRDALLRAEGEAHRRGIRRVRDRLEQTAHQRPVLPADEDPPVPHRLDVVVVLLELQAVRGRALGGDLPGPLLVSLGPLGEDLRAASLVEDADVRPDRSVDAKPERPLVGDREAEGVVITEVLDAEGAHLAEPQGDRGALGQGHPLLDVDALEPRANLVGKGRGLVVVVLVVIDRVLAGQDLQGEGEGLSRVPRSVAQHRSLPISDLGVPPDRRGPFQVQNPRVIHLDAVDIVVPDGVDASAQGLAEDPRRRLLHRLVARQHVELVRRLPPGGEVVGQG